MQIIFSFTILFTAGGGGGGGGGGGVDAAAVFEHTDGSEDAEDDDHDDDVGPSAAQAVVMKPSFLEKVAAFAAQEFAEQNPTEPPLEAKAFERVLTEGVAVVHVQHRGLTTRSKREAG